MKTGRLLTICTLALGLCAVLPVPFVSAEIPESAKNAMREAAEEQIEIKVVSVKQKAGILRFNLKLVVLAEVTEVRSSKTKLKVGDQITIEYSSPNPKAGDPPPGSYPRVLREGETCMAYLESEPVKEAEKRVYTPAAASGSF